MMPRKPNPDVLSRRLGDSVVLVHMGTNLVFELNETGALVWELLQSGANRDEILDRLMDEFEVEREQLGSDLDTLLRELEARDLLT